MDIAALRKYNDSTWSADHNLIAELLDALEVAQAENARLRDALAVLVEDCAPAPNEGHIPAAPSERSFMAARAALSECASKDPQ